MIIDDSRNVLAHLKAELHEESAVKASADMNIGDIVYLEMDENDGLTLRNGYATRRKYVVIIGKNEKGNLVGSLIVNSKITPFKRTAVMQQYQYLLRQSDYPQILNYDSWLDCTEVSIQPLFWRFENSIYSSGGIMPPPHQGQKQTIGEAVSKLT